MILLHPKIDELIGVLYQIKVQIVFIINKFPKKPNEKLKSKNIKTICFATTPKLIARKMIQNGIDALILEEEMKPEDILAQLTLMFWYKRFSSY